MIGRDEPLAGARKTVTCPTCGTRVRGESMFVTNSCTRCTTLNADMTIGEIDRKWGVCRISCSSI